MDFYEEQKQALRELDSIVKKNIIEKRKKYNVDILVIELTNSFSISEKRLRDRITAYMRIYPQLRIINGELSNIEVK